MAGARGNHVTAATAYEQSQMHGKLAACGAIGMLALVVALQVTWKRPLAQTATERANTGGATEKGARLLNFDSPSRVAGRYIVVFKNSAELADVPRSGRGAPKVLPDVVPTSKASIERLAAALAAQTGGTVYQVFSEPSLMGFWLVGASDADIRSILVVDPRIAHIEAELDFKLDGARQ